MKVNIFSELSTIVQLLHFSVLSRHIKCVSDNLMSGDGRCYLDNKCVSDNLMSEDGRGYLDNKCVSDNLMSEDGRCYLDTKSG